LGDAALEVGVVERMVLDMRREPPVGGIERGSLGPLRTVQLHSTPLCSSRKSQCSPARRAWCFCTTNIGAPSPPIAAAGAGSAAREKSRLARQARIEVSWTMPPRAGAAGAVLPPGSVPFLMASR